MTNALMVMAAPTVADVFFDFMHAVHPVSPEAEAYARTKAEVIKISKGSQLIRSGEYCEKIYFVHKGILRGFTRIGKKDITTWITAENEMVTSISSYYQHIPSVETIEALEDCTLVAMHRNDMQYMYAHFPEINTLARILLEKYYQDAEERAFICRLMEASAKYQRFIDTQNHLLNRIPPKYVASFLGMTLETLSRIRSRMSHQHR